MKTPAERLLDSVDWKPSESIPENIEGLPYVTHSGILKIGDLEIECVQLNTGQRLLTGPAIEALIQGLKTP